MIGALTMLSCILLVLSGGLVAGGFILYGCVLGAMGAGWNGILFTTYQHGVRDAKQR